MYTIVGLGNPGEEYKNTRHNVGMMALDLLFKQNEGEDWKHDKKRDSLSATISIGKEKALLLKPQMFMNRSGGAVKDLAGSPKKIKNLVVIHDDIDLPIGRIKISKNRSSGGHKGVESVIRTVKSEDFTRIRIGIAPTTPSGKLKKPTHDALVDNFITKNFKPNEEADIKKAIKRASEAVPVIMNESVEQAMTQFNKN